jgi:hypothetical protein
MSPKAQFKFGDIHCILREVLDSVLTEPFPRKWAEVLRQLDEAEHRRQDKGRRRRKKLDHPPQS